MTFSLLESPSAGELEEFLRKALRRRGMVQVAALCTVEYRGRAESVLEEGERLVIAERDGAFLVHGPKGYRPKNWQPSTDRFKVLGGNPVVLEARRSNPREVVRVTFHEVKYAVLAHLVDDEQLRLSGSEMDIQRALARGPETLEPGLRRVEREYRTDAGDVDLLARDGDGNYVAVEVKRNPGYGSAEQLDRYVRELKEGYGDNVRGILAAPEISSRLEKYLEKLELEGREIDADALTESISSIGGEQSSLDSFSF
ncbi:MAG: Endonuclease NucS [Methanonatronarchaeales archaeon]|nr:Endonuclease NucS [Methanonatronarchaeales archaeon]